MTLTIKDDETHRLARELAERTGKSITRAVKDALRDALGEQPTHARPVDRARIRELQKRIAADPDLSGVTGRALIDDLYDEGGLPG